MLREYFWLERVCWGHFLLEMWIEPPGRQDWRGLFCDLRSPLAGLRRVPVLGLRLSWVGGKLVPRESLTWVQVRHGIGQGLWLRLYPRTGQITFEGGSELEVQQALQEHLRPGMTFYDVGANIGFFTLVAARVVGNGGRVVAFEADPEIAERLRDHVAGNKFDWVVVKEKAVWSSSGPLQFARADRLRSPDRGLGHVVSGWRDW